MRPKNETLTIFAMLLAFLSLLICGWITASFMEARVYNKVTGSNITTWDAMWVTFRVSEAPRTNQ